MHVFSMQTAVERIMVECVECELSLSKHNGNIEDYTKSSVEVLMLLTYLVQLE